MVVSGVIKEVESYLFFIFRSVALILQVSLPLILFGNNKSHLTLKGGTNADFAPPIDYTINVFKPMVQNFGIDFECEINRRFSYSVDSPLLPKLMLKYFDNTK